MPPVLNDFVEPFAGRAIYTVFDLYWGYDARKVHPASRDLTTFQSPVGPLRITSMPMGYTNSVSEFQACTTFILQDEIPSVTNVFIDDIPIKGPATQYEDENGNPETIPGNPCSLHSPIDSRWTPHIPHELHGVQVESRWSPTHIAYFGVHSMESRWTPWNPSGIHLDSIDSRWTPGGIQLEFVKMKNRHLFINLKWILRLKKIDISYI